MPIYRACSATSRERPIGGAFAGFGLLGYLFRKAKCEPGPLLLGFVLGPLSKPTWAARC